MCASPAKEAPVADLIEREEALKLVMRLVKDPDDYPKVFAAIEALPAATDDRAGHDRLLAGMRAALAIDHACDCAVMQGGLCDCPWEATPNAADDAKAKP